MPRRAVRPRTFSDVWREDQPADWFVVISGAADVHWRGRLPESLVDVGAVVPYPLDLPGDAIRLVTIV